MMEALVEHTRALALDNSIRCVLVRGAGQHFMAGGDIKTFSTQLSLSGKERQEKFTQMIERLHASIEYLQRMPKPVVASVQGAVAGFGLSLMLACDLVIAADNSFFTSAYRHIALTPDGGCTFSLPRSVGVKKAMEIVLLSERLTTQDALRLGLINQVVAVEQLAEATQTLIEKLVNGPAMAMANAKRLINQSLQQTLAQQLRAEALSFGACAGTEDFAEGIRAFLEKRPATFNI